MIQNGILVMNAKNDKVVTKATIYGIGNFPAGIAYDPVNKLLYAVNNLEFLGGNGAVLAINATTLKTVKTIPVNNQPSFALYNPAGQDIYVSESASDKIVVINPRTNDITSNITVGLSPMALAYAPLKGLVYAADESSDNVSVIDGSTNTVVGNISVSGGPFDFTYNPIDKWLYVTERNGVNTYAGTNITAIDTSTNRVVANIDTGYESPQGIVYDPINGFLFVSIYATTTVLLINTSDNLVAAKLSVGIDPFYLIYDGFNGHIYVTCDHPGDSLYVLGIPSPSHSYSSIYSYLAVAATIIAAVATAGIVIRRRHRESEQR